MQRCAESLLRRAFRQFWVRTLPKNITEFLGFGNNGLYYVIILYNIYIYHYIFMIIHVYEYIIQWSTANTSQHTESLSCPNCAQLAAVGFRPRVRDCRDSAVSAQVLSARGGEHTCDLDVKPGANAGALRWCHRVRKHCCMSTWSACFKPQDTDFGSIWVHYPIFKQISKFQYMYLVDLGCIIL